MGANVLPYADRRELGFAWIDTYRASLLEGFTEAEAIEDISVLSGHTVENVTHALRMVIKNEW